MTFEIIKGDLFDPSHNFDALAQGVNTWGVMGAGIAVAFREKWPSMYNDYRVLCKRFGPDLAGSLHVYRDKYSDTEPAIFNMFSQIDPGRNGSYELLRKATVQMLIEAERNDHYKVGLPWIGCGIAGLAKHNVAENFHDQLSNSDVEFFLVEQ